MTPHLQAKQGDIAPIVLLPGDPLRAQHIANTMLTEVVQYNSVRNMLGFTGYYQGQRVSVQGSGMGMPSCSIYASELLTTYGCTTLIRVGTCGAMVPQLQLRDVVLAQAACTDSSMNKLRFSGMDYAPIADFGLLHKAYQAATAAGVNPRVGNIFSTDTFYNDHPDAFKLWSSYNVLAVEMEAAALYTLAAKHGAKALAILTVSDHLLTHQQTTPAERQSSFDAMVNIALQVATQ